VNDVCARDEGADHRKDGDEENRFLLGPHPGAERRSHLGGGVVPANVHG
jgi:hypothetical protein